MRAGFTGIHAVLLLGVAGIARAQDCPGFSAALAEVSAAHTDLVVLPGSEELDPFLQPRAQRGIEDSKAAIARLVAARMACAHDEGERDIEADFKRAMQSLDSGCDEHCRRSEYGDAPAFAVTRPKDHPRLVAITAKLAIPCGSDTALFVYEHVGAAWRERVRWHSEPYDKVSGALQAFEFQIAPSDTQGNWYVLVKDYMPWCSSTWTTIRYAALRPATAQAAQKIVLRADAEMWWGSDDAGRIRADVDSFDVRFHSYSIDLGIHNREWIRHYAIRGDTARRVQPVANTARDFADEWIVSPWTQARDWTDARRRVALQRWHERLRGKDMPNYEFAAVRACSDRADHVEVEMVDQRDQSDYFLSVLGSETDFQVTGVAEQGSGRCRGKDLLESMQTH